MQRKVKAEMGKKEELGGLITPQVLQISMSSIESLRIITSRVPAIELTHKSDRIEKTIAFSMQSDYFTQQTLVAIKRLKKLGKRTSKQKQHP